MRGPQRDMKRRREETAEPRKDIGEKKSEKHRSEDKAGISKGKKDQRREGKGREGLRAPVPNPQDLSTPND